MGWYGFVWKFMGNSRKKNTCVICLIAFSQKNCQQIAIWNVIRSWPSLAEGFSLFGSYSLRRALDTVDTYQNHFLCICWILKKDISKKAGKKKNLLQDGPLLQSFNSSHNKTVKHWLKTPKGSKRIQKCQSLPITVSPNTLAEPPPDWVWHRSTSYPWPVKISWR